MPRLVSSAAPSSAPAAIAPISRQCPSGRPFGASRRVSLSRISAALLCAAGVFAVRPAAAFTNYSDDPLNPSVVSANSLGQFIFDGHVGGTTSAGVCTPVSGLSCVDYVTINVPSGFQITGINLTSYDSTDDRAFIGVQAGSQFNTASLTNGVGMLGYNHFGWRGLCSASYGNLRPNPASSFNNCIDAANTTPQPTALNTNLLTNTYVGGANTSPVFNGPLQAGQYVFNIQQLSGDSVYTFTVQTSGTAAPGPLPVLGAGAAFGWSRRLRRRLGTTKPSA